MLISSQKKKKDVTENLLLMFVVKMVE